MTNKKYRAFEILIYFVMLFFAYVLQTTNIVFEYHSPAPSMLIAVFLVVSFFENFWFSALFGLITGVLFDSINVNGIGLYALTFLIIGSILGIVLENYMQNNFATFAVLGFAVILLINFVDVLIKSGFTNGIFSLFFRFYLLVSIYTFIAAFVLYLIFHFFIKKDERFVKPKGIIPKK